ncbi:cholesterol oxidase substrate-binding domain-containing protein [Silvanigrella aquatica]|uniref:FAD-binding PCMH-type domain-containing protein n=1 Tax=Silvanigrella aquatica TaxID=1915309 RepID=A0A1L4CYC9_9BACT|nr:cholesterol oxidase substrate-binding domain-containing protein [Silvanigrella aquatica]APJ02954.1 hypothetical protein AXG55_03100 [Silvanigrella aquatica]
MKKNNENKKFKYTNSRRNFISNFGKFAFISTAISSLPLLKKSFAGTSNLPQLPNFPSNIEIKALEYKNWSFEIQIPSIWTCLPKNTNELLAVINWAHQNNFKVRPKGKMHNWAPFTVPHGINPQVKVILIDMVTYFTKMSVNKNQNPCTVTAQTGILMDSLMAQLENEGLGFTATPAAGDLSLGGVLAINGHGASLPSLGENSSSLGQSYGSVSNLVVSLTAVVWDSNSNQYVLKTFERSNFECSAFLVHLGRVFIVEATLQVIPNFRMRCQSIMGISVSQMFGAPHSSPYNFSNFVDKTGRVEAILFPYTEKPWLKVWTVTDDKKPDTAKLVEGSYNYPFSDSINERTYKFIDSIVAGNVSITPTFGQFEYFIASTGLQYHNAFDLWGWSKNLLLYIKPTTLRMSENGYVIITKRENLQRVIYEFYNKYIEIINKYKAANKYPMNGPIEIRCTGLDNPSNMNIANAETPLLSALSTNLANSEWDVGIWIDILTFPGTPDALSFYKEIEEWIFQNYVGNYATVRVEWSKGWGYLNNSAWANAKVLQNQIPLSLNAAHNWETWQSAKSIFHRYDPNRIFTSPLHDTLGI